MNEQKLKDQLRQKPYWEQEKKELYVKANFTYFIIFPWAGPHYLELSNLKEQLAIRADTLGNNWVSQTQISNIISAHIFVMHFHLTMNW